MPKDSLTITDNRTGQSYEVAIENGTIRALDLRQIKSGPDDFGLMTYDPAFTNTASCKSRITFIDGDKGILNYRGYPIEALAEKSNYLETAYLILHGELPTKDQYDKWVYNITHHTMVHENIKELMAAFRYDAHPMGMLCSTVAALSTFYPEAKEVHDPVNRHNQIFRLIAKIPTLAAFAYRHSQGLPYAYPDNDLSYCGNFLQMMFKVGGPYKVNPVLEKALEVLFILHADHEQNCSTSTVRMVGSSRANLFASVAAGILALWGPLHGGANQEVIEMLETIHRDGGGVSKFVNLAKDKATEFRLFGFGHRVYKNYDPRARLIKKACDTVLDRLGIHDPLLDVARALEEAALSDPYFIERRLYPNVDFYSGIIYRALGFPTTMFTVMFALGRLPGWISQWKEQHEDKGTKIGRPRQIYVGELERSYVPMGQRG